MVRWLAPVLSFTAEEIWRALPGSRPKSVFLSQWIELPQGSHSRPHIDWNSILELRSAVSRELEKLRVQEQIGAPLDATVDIYATPALRELLAPFGAELRFVFITSGARVHRAEERPANAQPATEGEHNRAWIVVQPSADAKCIRCWHKQPDVGSHAAHAEICGRCVSNVEGSGEVRKYV
jgi:isoleucyl-tRNA synthetase